MVTSWSFVLCLPCRSNTSLCGFAFPNSSKEFVKTCLLKWAFPVNQTLMPWFSTFVLLVTIRCNLAMCWQQFRVWFGGVNGCDYSSIFGVWERFCNQIKFIYGYGYGFPYFLLDPYPHLNINDSLNNIEWDLNIQ